jgi:preprotein translocase subunit SecE
MATEKQSSMGLLVREVFRTDIYKRSQGRIARQVTFAALAVFVAAGVYSLNSLLANSGIFSGLKEYATGARYGINAILLAAGLWICYRVVNFSRFADFLISVEVEMNKVSWPSRDQLVRSSAVVLVTIFGMSAMMFGYDAFWAWLLTALRVIGS